MIHQQQPRSELSVAAWCEALDMAIQRVRPAAGLMESFFATLKTECIDRRYTTRQEACACIFDYIEV